MSNDAWMRPDIFETLTDAQVRYVRVSVDNPHLNIKEAALKAGLNPTTVYRWGNEVKEAIRQARIDVHEEALTLRKSATTKAVQVMITLLDDEDAAIRERAATKIIEWELGKAMQPTEIDASGDLRIRIVHDDDPDDS